MTIETPKTKALLLWQPKAPLLAHLQAQADPRIELIVPPDTEPETLLKLSTDATILVGWRPTREMIQQATQLKLLINPGAGVQHLVPVFKGLNFEGTIVNGHGNAFYTAQNTVALLLALAGKIVTHHNLMVTGKWRTGDKEGKSIPLQSKRIGLLGYGHVNKHVHKMLRAFGCEFNLLKRQWSSGKPADAHCFLPNELHQFLRQSDIVVAAVPLTAETEGLIDEEALSQLSNEALLVNVSRGAVFEEQALYQALLENKIAGAAIDVWYEYKPEADEQGRKYPAKFPFHTLENVVLSPHRAASPFDSLDRWDDVIHNLNAAVNGEAHINEVDLELGY